ncbi:MAG: GspE/PulE family protein [Proteobacteria bacterium]|nr:GspE/PulE family protein [Pseudomonadota bacterium]
MAREFRIDLRWVLAELEKDGLVAPEDARDVRTARRDPTDKQHPLEVVAAHELAHPEEAGQILSLDFLTAWLAEKAGLPVYTIDPLRVNVPATTAVMAFAFAERRDLLAVEVSARKLVVATAQPFERAWQPELQQTLQGLEIERVVANPADLTRYRIQFYNLAKSVDSASTGGLQRGPGQANFEQLLELGKLKAPDANDAHIVNVVDWLLRYAFDQRASDIHLEPRREMGNVRFRIDGVLHDVYELPPAVMAAVTSRLKILARMDVAEKRRPQDGRIKTKSSEGEEIELRLATLPTAFGEKLVLRIFDPEVLLRSYEELGLGSEELVQWERLTSQPHGILLVTGPTGSGKTTTLYSTLKQLATRERNVCTVEDPIEMVEPAFNQMQVHAGIDLGFADGVRALLRQDPDIIMVGEIRDRQTADMAIQAALTGHLVLSTLHTNDAPATLTRLLDLGVPAYLIASTVLGVMGQRLVRTLCPHCRVPAAVDGAVWESLVRPWKAPPPQQSFRAAGCLECRNTGYFGRLGLYEMMPLSDTLKSQVAAGADENSLRLQAYREGVVSLRLAGARKVAGGQTTPEEVLRVAPPAET